MIEVAIRPVELGDEPILWKTLMHAAHESALCVVKENPDLARYVKGWGRAGDLGVVAERPVVERSVAEQSVEQSVEQSRVPVGAAWVRIWDTGDRGYGYVADDVPELAIAVFPECRAQGIGTQLLTQLLILAKPRFPAVSLSIRADNPALRLYKRMNFTPVAGSEVINREGGRSFTMMHTFLAR